MAPLRLPAHLSYAGSMVKLIAVSFFSFVVSSVASLVWPRLTVTPRPVPLEQIHDVVLRTSIGQQAAQVLGVSDEKNIVPIHPSAVAASAASTIVATVEKRAQEVIVQNAVKQLTNQFDGLPQEQKLQIQTIICKP